MLHLDLIQIRIDAYFIPVIRMSAHLRVYHSFQSKLFLQLKVKVFQFLPPTVYPIQTLV